MNSDITSQFMFKLNEAKLGQDLKIADLVRLDFDNYVGIIERSLQSEMLGSCKRFNQQTQKNDFDTCVKENTKRISIFKQISKQNKNDLSSQYYRCRQNLKLMGFKPLERQAFHTIVDLEEASLKITESLQQEAYKTKANEWRK